MAGTGKPKPPRNGSQAVHLVLDRESYAALKTWCEMQQITVTALLESLGYQIIDQLDSTMVARVVVRRAQTIAAERRKRGR